ncbi:hypothetical protein JRQ81_008360 [Phrynocephalus forsythii]|uniref:dUTPase-like domain-containing protein n=1 Tax=Phrynocephalus forsythii TaxID=171643 RepID=A0A9Q1ATG6_9SAUR|nr:hypothetical protein JRQ81_008360 [Phrynocephalus forsythii]
MVNSSDVQVESPESPQRGETPKTEKQRARPKRHLYPVGFSKPVYPLNTPSRFGRAFEDLESSDPEPSTEKNLSSNDIFVFTGKPKSYAPQKVTRSGHHAEDTMTSELEMVSEDEGYESVNWGYQAPLSEVAKDPSFEAQLTVATLEIPTGGAEVPGLIAYPVIRGAAGQPDRYEALSFSIIKELQRSVRENGVQAPYTRAILDNLAQQKLIPGDWKSLIKAMMPLAQALVCCQEWADLAEEQARNNAANNVNIAAEMLTDHYGSDYEVDEYDTLYEAEQVVGGHPPPGLEVSFLRVVVIDTPLLSQLLPTSLEGPMPNGSIGMVLPRLDNLPQGIFVSAGLVSPDAIGPISIPVWTTKPVTLPKGLAIARLYLLPYEDKRPGHTTGACVALGFLTLPVQGVPHPGSSDHHKRSPPLGPGCSDQVIVSEQFSKDAATQGSAGAIFGALTLGSYPGIIAQENRKSIIGLACWLEKSINATGCLVRSLQNEIEQLNQILIQHRFALDYILAKKGGYCCTIGPQCHLDFHSLNHSIEDELTQMQSMLSNNLLQSPNRLSWLWDWLQNLSWLRQIIIAIVIIIVILTLICCCIQCLPNLLHIFLLAVITRTPCNSMQSETHTPC